MMKASSCSMLTKTSKSLTRHPDRAFVDGTGASTHAAEREPPGHRELPLMARKLPMSGRPLRSSSPAANSAIGQGRRPLGPALGAKRGRTLPSTGCTSGMAGACVPGTDFMSATCAKPLVGPASEQMMSPTRLRFSSQTLRSVHPTRTDECGCLGAMSTRASLHIRTDGGYPLVPRSVRSCRRAGAGSLQQAECVLCLCRYRGDCPRPSMFARCSALVRVRMRAAGSSVAFDPLGVFSK
ncbi:hypothetical protein FB382_001302 [Nocardioides ginsengisegetis]|uniref:Uncharacterized protein n=1 Tax=Nocardioides ginsengisegetis TaxID=661491 RepID=A0A7W3IYL8_9ACTN|nr:hypothetical protein [Nocardioides ginsengisegetis]